jgi:hypothetical protein
VIRRRAENIVQAFLAGFQLHERKNGPTKERMRALEAVIRCSCRNL